MKNINCKNNSINYKLKFKKPRIKHNCSFNKGKQKIISRVFNKRRGLMNKFKI